MDVKLHGNETVSLTLSENGQFIPLAISNINRGFLFGDGLFETMIFTGDKIRYKDAHLSRLLNGCKVLQMDMKNPDILNLLEAYINNTFPQKSIRIRWNVYRNGLGKYTPESNLTDHLFILQLHQYSPPSVKKAYINYSIKIPALPWSNCKTLNSLVYVMANLERKDKKYDEVILLNSEGYVCEAGAANLFWIKDSIYYTPSLDSNCVAGIGRKAIIEELTDQGLELIQGKFKPKDILSADQVFTSNVTGIHYISQIDIREFDTTPIPFLEKLFV